MITKELIEPYSIAVIGASNDLSKPGGRIVKHIIDGNFAGKIYPVNPKEDNIQNLKCYHQASEIPNVDLAVIAIGCQYTIGIVEHLVKEKECKAIIILSAGFGEAGHEGKILEEKIAALCDEYNCALIGPNCTGILTPYHQSIFTGPIPQLDKKGCDLISGSGATIVFILEQGIQMGLRFAHIFSVGNSAQIGVEDILQYMDESFNPETSSRVKLLYMESVRQPQKLLKHARSLVKKGCRIAAIKAGTSEAGSRAASSHTGALAGSDAAVDALFRKAGIVRCYGRQDLMTVAAVFQHPRLEGKNIGIVTHAGGPAVMLTDTLSKSLLNVPNLPEEKTAPLLEKLFSGSTANNPVDFLATGTAEQLGLIIDHCNTYDEIDGIVVIFGKPGLFDLYDVVEVLHQKMLTSRKPIFPVLPSLTTSKNEIDVFLSKGHINFPEETVLGAALGKTFYTPDPIEVQDDIKDVDVTAIRAVIDNAADGYLSAQQVQVLLDSVKISRVNEVIAKTLGEATSAAASVGYPIVMKVVGPIHKSDVNGVVLNVNDYQTVTKEFSRMMNISGVTGVLIQSMVSGKELFAGVKYEPKFGHLILCGLGGIFVEVLKDVRSALAPVSEEEAMQMIYSLKGYKMLQGMRGQKGVSLQEYAKVILSLSRLVAVAPEITEMDINPLLAFDDKVIAVDARINIVRR
ncbi:MAG: acetate--CoA ligase family protein [Bacteroidales bacterium]|jgi:acetyltransferase|nr:acetate--CoA ligase family protein [Bacteroidales bacterium]